MYILGISCYYHDAAACLINNGKIISAVQEERFTRIKNDESFPTNSIKFLLKSNSITPKDLNYVVFYEKPFLKFDRILQTYLHYAPLGFENFKASFQTWIKKKLFQKADLINKLSQEIGNNVLWKEKILFSEHHLSHAASAFYPSPFIKAAILTMDGVGEWTTTSIGIGKKNNIELIEEIKFPHSLGLLYSAFTYYLGFKVNSDEYKVMGLAPYGKPIYKNIIISNLLELKEDGSFKLNMKYFSYCTNLKMTNKLFDKLFNFSKRNYDQKILKVHMDIAASIQSVTEEIVVKISKYIKQKTLQENLCISGGVGLNCVVNGILKSKNIFKNIWVQPASGDAGGALGAALCVYYLMQKKTRIVKHKDSMSGCYLGPKFTNKEVEKTLNNLNANFHYFEDSKLIEHTAKYISEGKFVGWMSGKMEFGPRSLGARSILADPRKADIQKKLNLKIKFRESFRPFAPCVLYEEAKNWFELDYETPYMLFVSNVHKNKLLQQTKVLKKSLLQSINDKRSIIPSVTHVDNSARVQTLTKSRNKKFYELVKKFFELTGVPIIVNTSFNVKDEPIVCTPLDAYKCFMSTNLDVLIIENYMLLKKNQKNILYIKEIM